MTPRDELEREIEIYLNAKSTVVFGTVNGTARHIIDLVRRAVVSEAMQVCENVPEPLVEKELLYMLDDYTRWEAYCMGHERGCCEAAATVCALARPAEGEET